MTSNISYVKKSMIYSLFFTVIGSIAGFLFRMLLARNLSVEEYGLFFSVFGLVLLVNSFKDIGTGKALSKFIPEWQAKKNNVKINSALKTVLILMVSFSIIAALMLVLTADILADHYFKHDAAKAILIILSAMAVFKAVTNWLSHSHIAFKRIGLATSIANIQYLSVLLITFLLFQIKVDVIMPAIAYVITVFSAAIIYSLIFKIKVFKKLSLKSNISKKMFYTLIGYGKYFVIAGIGIMVIAHLDIIMITAIRGLEEVGLYNAAWPLANLIATIGTLLASTIMPLSSSLKHSNKEKSLQQGLVILYKYFFFVAFPFIAVMMVFPKEIIALIFGASYVSAAPALQIFVLGSVIFNLALITFGVLGGIGKADVQAKAYLFMSIANIMVNAALIPYFGYIGASIATFISYLIGFIIAMYYARKNFELEIPWISWIKTFIAATVSVAIVYLLKVIIQWNNLGEVTILGTSMVFIYMVLIALLKIVNLKELRSFVKIVVKS